MKYFESYHDDNKLYLCMELCTGGDFFNTVVDQGKTLSEEEAAVQMVAILKALVHCHA